MPRLQPLAVEEEEEVEAEVEAARGEVGEAAAGEVGEAAAAGEAVRDMGVGT